MNVGTLGVFYRLPLSVIADLGSVLSVHGGGFHGFRTLSRWLETAAFSSISRNSIILLRARTTEPSVRVIDEKTGYDMESWWY